MLAAATTILAASTCRAQTDNGHYTCHSHSGEVFYNPCTGEDVLFTDGQTCITFSMSVDASGGVHFTGQIKTDFVGVGLTTGQSYVEHNAVSAVENFSGTQQQYEMTFKQNYHVNTSGSDSTLYTKDLEHITVDANGNVTSMVVIIEFDGCK
jgi:hypothetical protein